MSDIERLCLRGEEHTYHLVTDGACMCGAYPDAAAQQAAADRAEIERAERLAEAGNTVSAYVYAMQNPGTIPIHVRMAMNVFEEDQAHKAKTRRALAAATPTATGDGGAGE